MPSYEQAALEELLLRDELRKVHQRVNNTKGNTQRQFLGHEIADLERALVRNGVEPYLERRPKHGQESDEPV